MGFFSWVGLPHQVFFFRVHISWFMCVCSTSLSLSVCVCIFQRCLFRVLDSFGTEPQFNFKKWKPTKREYGRTWGNWELNPRQFMTMYRKYSQLWSHQCVMSCLQCVTLVVWCVCACRYLLGSVQLQLLHNLLFVIHTGWMQDIHFHTNMTTTSMEWNTNGSFTALRILLLQHTLQTTHSWALLLVATWVIVPLPSQRRVLVLFMEKNYTCGRLCVCGCVCVWVCVRVGVCVCVWCQIYNAHNRIRGHTWMCWVDIWTFMPPLVQQNKRIKSLIPPSFQASSSTMEYWTVPLLNGYLRCVYVYVCVCMCVCVVCVCVCVCVYWLYSRSLFSGDEGVHWFGFSLWRTGSSGSYC